MDKVEFSANILEKARLARSNYNVKSMRGVISESLNSASSEFSTELKNRMKKKLKYYTIAVPIQSLNATTCAIYMITIQEIAIEELQLGLDYKVSIEFVNNYITPIQSFTCKADSTLKNGLNVQSLLAVIGYSLDIAKQLDMPAEHIKSGIVGLKVIDRVFSNQPKEEYKMKDLGLAVEIVATAAEYFVDDKIERQYIGLSSMIFNLAIDFFYFNIVIVWNLDIYQVLK